MPRNTHSQVELTNINDEHVRWIPPREAYALEASAMARLFYLRRHGKPSELVGAQLLQPVTAAAAGGATIRKSEVLANAGLYGRSFTERLPERRRVEHRRRVRIGGQEFLGQVEAEDFVERAETKIGIWPLVHDTKAVRVGPRPDDRAYETALRLAGE